MADAAVDSAEWITSALLNAYFAGLIDGEGNIAIYDQKYCKAKRPVIKVDMTCEKTISALHDHFGGSKGKKKVYNGNKPQWRWEVTSLNARRVAAMIAPFLLTKKQNALEILALPITPRGRPPSK